MPAQSRHAVFSCAPPVPRRPPHASGIPGRKVVWLPSWFSDAMLVTRWLPTPFLRALPAYCLMHARCFLSRGLMMLCVVTCRSRRLRAGRWAASLRRLPDGIDAGLLRGWLPTGGLRAAWWDGAPCSRSWWFEVAGVEGGAGCGGGSQGRCW